MKCPHCNQDTKLPEYVSPNVRTYQETVISILTCCNKAVIVKPILSYEIKPYLGNKAEDDWGKPISQVSNIALTYYNGRGNGKYTSGGYTIFVSAFNRSDAARILINLLHDKSVNIEAYSKTFVNQYRKEIEAYYTVDNNPHQNHLKIRGAQVFKGNELIESYVAPEPLKGIRRSYKSK